MNSIYTHIYSIHMYIPHTGPVYPIGTQGTEKNLAYEKYGNHACTHDNVAAQHNNAMIFN